MSIDVSKIKSTPTVSPKVEKVVEQGGDIKKGFELGSYQDREPKQAPATSPQSTPVSTASNDTNTPTSDK